MKINDIKPINEAVYGFDDIKTAASSIIKNFFGQGLNLEQSQKYAMRDRAVRLVARGFSDQWGNIVYDLRRMFEKDIQNNPSKGAQNKQAIQTRLMDVIKETGASENNNEVADAVQTILDATIDASGKFQPQSKLVSANVLNAWTKIVASGVTNTAFHNMKNKQPAQVQQGVMLGNTYKAKDKNDYGKKIVDNKLKLMMEPHGNTAHAWYDNAILPALIVVQATIEGSGMRNVARYIKLDGIWYNDSQSINSSEARFEKDEIAEKQGYHFGQADLDRITQQGADQYDNILWAGAWGIQRMVDAPNRFQILPANKYQEWATTTSRTITNGMDPASYASMI